MKTVCRVLGVARSHVHELRDRAESWCDGRIGRTPASDADLLAEIREHIAELPSYGYRRACALVNRQRAQDGAARINLKWAYRVMSQAGLWLPKAPRRRQSSRPHDGVVAVERGDLRWCSDGVEIKCDSGETVTATFAKDCCDREVMAWRAWDGKGLPGKPVREMLIEAVESRFGNIETIPHDHVLEFLSDNGGAYVAAETRRVARQLGSTDQYAGMQSPRATGWPRASFKRDYGRDVKVPLLA